MDASQYELLNVLSSLAPAEDLKKAEEEEV